MPGLPKSLIERPGRRGLAQPRGATVERKSREKIQLENLGRPARLISLDRGVSYEL